MPQESVYTTSKPATLVRLYRGVLFNLKYARLHIWQAVLRPVQSFARARRMSAFLSQLKVKENANILDLGGQPMIWSSVDKKLNLTILNLPGVAQQHYPSSHSITYVEGDACNVDAYPDLSFDIVFSNSVIEHVGDDEKLQAFAREVMRLGRSYWIQTPSRYFPIEAHSGTPFWWLYPQALRRYFISRWRRKLPLWTEMIEGTRFIDRSQLRTLFPKAQLSTERLFGIPKSYVASFLAPEVREP